MREISNSLRIYFINFIKSYLQVVTNICMPHITVQVRASRPELNQEKNCKLTAFCCKIFASSICLLFIHYFEFEPFTFDAGLLLRGELGREHFGLDSVDSLVSIKPLVSSLDES